MFITDAALEKNNTIKHAYFTRQGGVSEGIYASLNTGPGSQDNPDNVEANRERAMQALGTHHQHLSTLYQVHSNIVHVTKQVDMHAAIEGDAQVTNIPGIVLGVLTADCGPILFADPKAKVIGAAHAGWKGALGGVIENTVTYMEALGASRQHITAALGPCIRQASYEVDAGFHQRFIAADATNADFFMPSAKAEHSMFDLAGYITRKLQQLNLAEVSDVKRDTCAEEELFFSYRRTCLQGQTKEYGRLLSAIMLQ